jgi:GTP cyclohydrolase I
MKASSTDPILGRKVGNFLLEKGIETPIRYSQSNMTGTAQEHAIKHHFTAIMEALNLNLEDDSLAETPKRIAKMFVQEVFYGLDYANFPKCTAVENKMGYDEVVQVKAQVKSMCEHHFVPIVGKAYVAYLPKDKVIGLSKINRIVDFFCRRPQIQERLTEQVAHALSYILETDDIAVVIKGVHMCVSLRGAEDTTSETVTSRLMGRFKNTEALRAEFMSLTRI